jgi:hypothetical protein
MDVPLRHRRISGNGARDLRHNGGGVIEDYALIGDCQTAALVSRQGRSTGCACTLRFAGVLRGVARDA